ncbi:MAG: BGTF surface domain-containing protein [Halobacteriota archaeon]
MVLTTPSGPRRALIVALALGTLTLGFVAPPVGHDGIVAAQAGGPATTPASGGSNTTPGTGGLTTTPDTNGSDTPPRTGGFNLTPSTGGFNVSFERGASNRSLQTNGSTPSPQLDGTNVSLEYEGSRLVLRSAPNQSVVGRSDLRPGTEVVVTIESGVGIDPSFLTTNTTAVEEDGRFRSTFNLSEERGYVAGSRVTVSVSRGNETLTAVDGLLVAPESDQSETATEEASNESGQQTASSAGESSPTSDGQTASAGPTPTPGATQTDTVTSARGFGVAVGLIAVLLGSLLVWLGFAGD